MKKPDTRGHVGFFRGHSILVVRQDDLLVAEHKTQVNKKRNPRHTLACRGLRNLAFRGSGNPTHEVN